VRRLRANLSVSSIFASGTGLVRRQLEVDDLDLEQARVLGLVTAPSAHDRSGVLASEEELDRLVEA
jgi:hypothetical protein